MTFWYDFIEYTITTHRRYTRLMTRTDQASLSLIDVQIAFFILFIGLCLASILFMMEIFYSLTRKDKLFKCKCVN